MSNLEKIIFDLSSLTSDLGLRFQETVFLYQNRKVKVDDIYFILDFSIDKLKKRTVKLYTNLDEEKRNENFDLFCRYFNTLEKINTSFYLQIDSFGLSKNLIENFSQAYFMLSKAVKCETKKNYLINLFI